EFGFFSSFSRTMGPARTSSPVRRAYSSSDPSPQWIRSGWVSSAISSTQASSRACFVFGKGWVCRVVGVSSLLVVSPGGGGGTGRQSFPRSAPGGGGGVIGSQSLCRVGPSWVYGDGRRGCRRLDSGVWRCGKQADQRQGG